MHEALKVRGAAWFIAKIFKKAIKEDTHAWGAFLGDNLVEAFLSQWSHPRRA